MKVLVNLSNHPSENWSSEQLSGWDEIIDIRFPSIDPYWDFDDVINNAIIPTLHDLQNIINSYSGAELYLNLQGEYSYCYTLLLKYLYNREFGFRPFKLVVPTTQRVVKEVHNSDGSVVKTSNFMFCKWRSIEI